MAKDATTSIDERTDKIGHQPAPPALIGFRVQCLYLYCEVSLGDGDLPLDGLHPLESRVYKTNLKETTATFEKLTSTRNHQTMTNHPMLKPTKAKKAKKAGSGTKKSSSGTKKPSSSEPVQEQAGKGSQHAAGSPVAVHSYTALLSCNGKQIPRALESSEISDLTTFFLRQGISICRLNGNIRLQLRTIGPRKLNWMNKLALFLLHCAVGIVGSFEGKQGLSCV